MGHASTVTRPMV